MYVAKGFSCLRWSFATPNVRKLVVRQLERNDGYCLLHTFSYSFLAFVSWLEGGGASDSSTMHQRSTKTNPISNLNFQRLKIFSLNLSMTLASSSSNDAMLRSKIVNIFSNYWNQRFLNSYMHPLTYKLQSTLLKLNWTLLGLKYALKYTQSCSHLVFLSLKCDLDF